MTHSTMERPRPLPLESGPACPSLSVEAPTDTTAAMAAVVSVGAEAEWLAWLRAASTR
jgi:hypothetical protein